MTQRYRSQGAPSLPEFLFQRRWDAFPPYAQIFKDMGLHKKPLRHATRPTADVVPRRGDAKNKRAKHITESVAIAGTARNV